MSGLVQGLFGGGQPAAPPIVIQPSPGPAPTPPTNDDAAAKEAARKERAAMAQSVGRSNTILTDFALATQAPGVLKKTLGGA